MTDKEYEVGEQTVANETGKNLHIAPVRNANIDLQIAAFKVTMGREVANEAVFDP